MGLEEKLKSMVDILHTVRSDVANECYLQCLAVESGEGECAEAIRQKFPEYITKYLR